MSCEELRGALPAYLDGELDVAETLAVERHLAECRECGEIAAHERAFRAAFRDPSLKVPAPEALRERVYAATRERTRFARPRRIPFRAWMAAAALLVIGVAIGTLATRFALVPAPERVTADEVLSAHLRSLLGNHLTDVASSDRHTVKPWFAGKLDYSPTVVDLAAEGFPLDGGRLDALGGRPVAALVYRRRLHVISVYTEPASATTEASQVALTKNGYHLVGWAHAGMRYWAVSDLDAQELRNFAALLAAAE